MKRSERPPRRKGQQTFARLPRASAGALLGRFAQVLGRRWVVGVLAAVGTATACFIALASAPRAYTATALLVFEPGDLIEPSRIEAHLAAEQSAITSPAFAERLAARLAAANGAQRLPAATIRAALSTQRPGRGYAIAVRARAPERAAAARFANLAASEHLEQRLERPFAAADGVKAELERARAALREAERALKQLQSDPETPANALAAAERDVEATRAAHDARLASLIRTAAADGEVGYLRLVAPADAAAATASFTVGRGVLIALAVGFLFGLAAAAAAQAIDDTVLTPEDIAWRLRARTICLTPLLRRSDYKMLAPDRRSPLGFVIDRPQSEFAEAVRALRTTLLAGARRKRAAVAVVAPKIGAGASTMAVALARSAAGAGVSTLLVDCADDHDDAASALYQPTLGAVDPAARDWRALVEYDSEDLLHVLAVARLKAPGEAAVGKEPALQSTDGDDAGLAQVLREARERYDFIVIDAGPVLGRSRATSAARRADTVVLVVRGESTRLGAARAAQLQLLRGGCRLAGVTLNGAKQARERPPYASAGAGAIGA